MKILIVGLGSIGRRHLNNILSIYPEAEIILLRHSKKPESETISGVGQVVYSLSDAIKADPDVAFITNPSPFHIPVAIELAKKGIHLFIEKPLSQDLNGVYEFSEICKKNNNIVMVGFNYRFKKSLMALKDALHSDLIGKILSYRGEVGQYLPDWRMNSDYRQTVSARKELGGGALLELSHEFDYSRWLMGEVDSVCAIAGKYSDMEIDVEDIAEIILQFKSGAIGNIHLDMVNRVKTRTCTIIGSDGTLIWNAADNSLKIISNDFPQGSYLVSPNIVERNQMQLDEIIHFFSCIRDGKNPSVSIDDGIAALEIIAAVRKSSSEMRCVKV
jgi:predicted dehydrogenase